MRDFPNRYLGLLVIGSIIIGSYGSNIVHASPTNSVTASIQESENLGFTWVWEVTGGNNIGNMNLDRLQDLNNDGDFGGAGENDVIIGQTGGSCIAFENELHIACIGGAITTSQFGIQYVLIKNGSVEHRPGNYTFSVQLRDAVNNVIAQFVATYSIVADTSTNTQVKEFESRNNHTTRASEDRMSLNVTGESQGTRVLINTTVLPVKADTALILQNLTINYPFTWNLINISSNGGDVNVSANLTANLTASRLGGLCDTQLDGTPAYCLFSHQSPTLTPASDETARFLGVLVIFAIILAISVQRGFALPLIGAFIGTGLLFFLVSHNSDFLQSQLTTILLTLMALVVTLVGPVNMLYRWTLLQKTNPQDGIPI